jgi:phenylpropionate dioxygenase-like ring-hydroxylating dioxygenase large terminal subunit
MGSDRIPQLLARQPKGATLLQEFYADPEIFQRDLDRIHLVHWICAGHESRIREPGSWFRFDLAGESIIVVRGRDGHVRALVNVCRHRGSRVCYEPEGQTRMLVCPYHAWTYDLDGQLRAARQMGSDFDKSAHALHKIHARVAEGLVFVCFAEQPPAFDHAEETLAAGLGPYGWQRAKVAHRATYSVDANWKLATENYQECYHCAPAHPEFSRSHATEKPDDEVVELRAESDSRAQRLGIEIPTVLDWPVGRAPDEEMVDCFHDALYPGYVTGSEDGKAVAPLMGDFTEYDGGYSYLDVGPSSFFLAYPDYGVMYLFVPRGPQRTDMEISWLVADDAAEGEDYDGGRLIWLWDVTSVSDKRIIDENQQGVSSRFYQPGPYGPMEPAARAFAEWYLQQMSDSGTD